MRILVKIPKYSVYIDIVKEEMLKKAIIIKYQVMF